MGRALKKYKVNVYMTDVKQVYVDAVNENEAEEKAKKSHFADKYRRDCDLVDFEVAAEVDDGLDEL